MRGGEYRGVFVGTSEDNRKHEGKMRDSYINDINETKKQIKAYKKKIEETVFMGTSIYRNRLAILEDHLRDLQESQSKENEEIRDIESRFN